MNYQINYKIRYTKVSTIFWGGAGAGRGGIAESVYTDNVHSVYKVVIRT